ncbi:DUF2894 domain-containing protein [Pandoraea cepalis]|uniref:DUF2894 domain-containing protein n=1 Tax=Pandoraea cepalis TaxID=2508294 RepID=A0AAW7MQZ2_9BURK|nr:DUF2894 domain-containing protein [Pandoraea cepalis]MDN4575287.1 DUF2894 domain-containing protein [Pandoraea cepalis]MDN4579357.1 DUF2894 domain-containing protein [Pandoraea cepalis]
MRDAMHAEVGAAQAHEATDALSEQLAAWRAHGADKRDPVRFHRIEALALRSRAFRGDVRRVLDERLTALVDAFAQSLGAAGAESDASDASPTSPTSPTSSVSASVSADDAPPTTQRLASPLAELTASIAQRVAPTRERSAPPTTSSAAKAATPPGQTLRDGASTSTTDTVQPVSGTTAPPKRPVASPAPVALTPTVIATDDAFDDLDVLEYFRETWSKVSTDGNLRQSLAQVPENAGPLNSSHLVHRALSLMHDISPDYLRHFLRHADALSWLEDMETTGALGNKPAARVAAKPSRTKAR